MISESVDVLSGIPQESILGPLLFVLFINDIYENIDKDTNIALFADDTKIWRDIKSEADCEILQKDINTLTTWSRKNKMSFHPVEHLPILTKRRVTYGTLSRSNMSRRSHALFSELANATKIMIFQSLIKRIEQHNQRLFDNMWSEHMLKVEKREFYSVL